MKSKHHMNGSLVANKFVKDANVFRKRQGLPKLKAVKRECLRCDKPFTAIGKINRLCYQCLKYDSVDTTPSNTVHI